MAGLILELDRPAAGTLEVETVQTSFRVSIGFLDEKGRTYRAGGLGKQIAACRLPAADGARSLTTSFRLKRNHLGPGDNPISLHAVQENG